MGGKKESMASIDAAYTLFEESLERLIKEAELHILATEQRGWLAGYYTGMTSGAKLALQYFREERGYSFPVATQFDKLKQEEE